MTKDRVLEYVQAEGRVTADALAHRFRISPKAAYDHLRRHARAGLLTTTVTNRFLTDRYTLTDRGRRYLAHREAGEQGTITFR